MNNQLMLNTEEFKSKGIIIIKNFFTENENEYLKTLCKYISDKNIDFYIHDSEFIKQFKQSTFHYLKPHIHFGEFKKIIEKRKLKNLAEKLYASPMKIWSSLLLYSPKNSGMGQSWHQDLDSVKLPFVACNMLTYPFGLKGSSTLKIVKGSHKYSSIPKGDPFGKMEGEISIKADERDLVILDCGVFHMVPQNISEFDRYAFNVRFIKSNIKSKAITVGVYRTGSYDFETNTVINYRD